MVGVRGMTATYVNQVGPLCVPVSQTGQWIGTPVERGLTGKVGTASFSKICPVNSAISGFRGSFSQYVNQLDFECRALTANGKLTGAGTYSRHRGSHTGHRAGSVALQLGQSGVRAVWPLGRMDGQRSACSVARARPRS